MSVSARAQLAADLMAAVPDVRVIGFTPTLDVVTRPTVVLWQSGVDRREEFDGRTADVEFEMWVLVPQEDPGAAEDALDVTLGEFLQAWRGIEWCQWVRAERGVYGDTWHGYRITATTTVKIDEGLLVPFA